MNLERKFLWGSTALAGLLLGYAASLMWNRVDAHEGAILIHSEKIQTAEEMTREMRSDVKEIRDAVRRIEGAINAPTNP